MQVRGDRQHVLPQRHVRQHILDQVGRRLRGSPSRGAPGTGKSERRKSAKSRPVCPGFA
jgi:hypothetical protein